MSETLYNPQQSTKMKVLNITSTEALDVAVAEVVRLKIKYTEATAAKDAETAAIEKDHQTKITALVEAIAELEGRVQEYCTAHRVALFPEKKSRETSLAVFGFEFTPHRVETANKKIHWKDVVKRLLRLPWGKAYVRKPEPKPDKEALLADREKLTEEQCTAAGIQFCQDEQFFIRPKPETTQASVMEAA
jgi:phage host-nuclease inhibitor protein Gam